ncbi:hypothetical protein [Paenibacillus sp. P32E]|uniref:hypothetical protein n=1 Tax=Paenibacillus sp. P32E TaxID=1349434 RepID=UPI00093E2E05|nr:hypothetical protein [Paenibacillus sp. P32E]OKP84766.1 hypothetical protein A3848_23850 [Paenibacillus sp. P32E]
MKRSILIVLTFILIFITVACSQGTSIDIGDALGKSEENFRKLEVIDTTAASFDGEKDVKFRLMVEGNPSEVEASILFNRILEVIAKYSNRSDVWDYYNGYFDIENHDDGVIYEGEKLIDEELIVQSK